MAYTPVADGTQAFGIPDSPVSINSVTYIAEDIQFNNGTERVVIKDPNGIPSGANILQGDITGTCRLQLATASTPLPPKASLFTLFGKSYYVLDIGASYTQGDYTKVNITFAWQINP
ncbi:MAG: hypothetical protein JSR30_00070 [Proteobacteria bacterium]|nr:hypothetical protein [Pseudomonadota bacterium]